MAIAVNGTSSYDSGSTLVTQPIFSHTAPANAVLFVAFSYGDSRTVSSVDFNGDALSIVPSSLATNTDNARKIEWWYLLTPDSGAHDITITMNSNSRMRAAGITLTGHDTVTPFGAVATASNVADSTSNSTNIATTKDGAYVIDFMTNAAVNSAPTAAGSQTSFATGSAAGSNSFGASYLSVPTATTQAMGWSWTGSSGTAHTLVEVVPPTVVTFKPFAMVME